MVAVRICLDHLGVMLEMFLNDLSETGAYQSGSTGTEEDSHGRAVGKSGAVERSSRRRLGARGGAGSGGSGSARGRGDAGGGGGAVGVLGRGDGSEGSDDDGELHVDGVGVYWVWCFGLIIK